MIGCKTSAQLPGNSSEKTRTHSSLIKPALPSLVFRKLSLTVKIVIEKSTVVFSSRLEERIEHPFQEKQAASQKGDYENLRQEACKAEHTSTFKNLGMLDRFLAVWILLVMAVGILLGNFVPETSPALQRGQFVGVSVPTG